MKLELGIGQHPLIVCNIERHEDINAMFERIATAYSAMLCMGYPVICYTYRQCKILFTDGVLPIHAPCVAISLRACGLYITDHPYNRKVTRELHAMTGLPISRIPFSGSTVEIGLGGIDVVSEGYALLKDALLYLPSRIF